MRLNSLKRVNLFSNLAMFKRSLNWLISKSLSQVPLRMIFVVPLLVQIFTIVGVMGWLSFRHGRQAVNEVASQLQDEITAHIEDNLEQYLAIPHQINQSNKNAIELGELTLKNLDHWQQHLLRQVQLFDAVSYISVANVEREVIVAGRQNHDELVIIHSDSATDFNSYTYTIHGKNNANVLLEGHQKDDSYFESWYTEALNVSQATWSEVYPDFTQGDRTLMISAIQPVYDSQHQIQGVLKTTLHLSSISKFLNTLKIGRSGRLFIMERSGALITTSTPNSPLQNNQEQVIRLQATQSDDPLIQSTANYLIQKFDNLNKIKDSQHLEFKRQGKQNFVEVRPLQDSYGLDWLIVVVFPEADFMGHIYAHTRSTIILCIVALIISTAIALGTAHWIIQPIQKLNQAVYQIREGQWVQPIQENSSAELNNMNNNFYQMSNQLNQYIIKIKHENNQLNYLNKALLISEKQLSRILDFVPVGILVLDTKYHFYYINEKAKSFMKKMPKLEIIDDCFSEKCDWYIADKNTLYPLKKLPIISALQGYNNIVDDIEIHQDNQIIRIESWGKSIVDEQGKIIYAIAVLNDITERKKAEAERMHFTQALEFKDYQNAALQHLDKLKDEFLANISEQLRTPLQGMITIAESLMDGGTGELPLPTQINLSTIVATGRHLSNLVNDILDFAKLRHHDIKLQRRPVGLREIADIVLSISYPLVGDKNLKLINQITPDLPIAYADENRVHQILQNLVENAIKFTDQGTVKISARLIVVKANLDDISSINQINNRLNNQDINNKKIKTFPVVNSQITATSPQIISQSSGFISEDFPILHSSSLISNPPYDQKMLAITIADTGIGIPKSQINCLFEFFEQNESLLGCKYISTGLGLALTKKLVELQGGTLELKSDLGIGSEFTFTLPVFEGQVEEIKPNICSSTVSVTQTVFSLNSSIINKHKLSTYCPLSFPLEQSNLTLKHYQDSHEYECLINKFKILIVDDDSVSRHIIFNYLSLENYQLVQASNGREALDIIERGFQPDLVLLDSMMPRMTGYDVCKKIRESYLPTELPVLMLTAKEQVNDLVAGFSVGVNDYLTKPIEINKLLVRIKTHLRLSTIAKENARLYLAVCESERRLTQFLEAVPVGIFILDAQGKPYYANEAAKQILGKGIMESIPVHELAEVYQVYRAGTNQVYPSEQMPAVLALQGICATVDDIEIHRGNEIIPIEVWGTPIYEKEGKVAYAMAAFQDIRDRKKAEAERAAFTHKLFQLNQAYERFVPRQFLQFLDKKSIVDVQLGDHVQREMSVLFADIRNFTALSEQMNPSENFQFINAFLSRMEPAIRENNGFVDKYIGDEIMALFSGNADEALQAGIAMFDRLALYNQHRAKYNYEAIEIGIGINTGELMLGTVGGFSRMDSTVISDAVNLAARLEELTKIYQVRLLISHHTFLKLSNSGDYGMRLVDKVNVKGKTKKVTVYEVFEADPPEMRKAKLMTKTMFEQGLLFYYRDCLREAAQHLSECLQVNPEDTVASYYLKRCQHRMR